MSFPMLGSQTNAYAATLHVQGIKVRIDYVFFRVGPVAGIISYEDLGQPDPSSVNAYAMEAVNKIEGRPTVAPVQSPRFTDPVFWDGVMVRRTFPLAPVRRTVSGSEQISPSRKRPSKILVRP
jgi:hypothetical protein